MKYLDKIGSFLFTQGLSKSFVISLTWLKTLIIFMVIQLITFYLQLSLENDFMRVAFYCLIPMIIIEIIWEGLWERMYNWYEYADHMMEEHNQVGAAINVTAFEVVTMISIVLLSLLWWGR